MFRAQNQTVVLRARKHSFCPQWIWRWVGKTVEREVGHCGPNSPALIAWDHLPWHHITWTTKTNLGLTIACMVPNPRVEPRSPKLQANSLPAEPQGKPKNSGMGSLPLLQRIFPTQESNQGLLHCRRILYQLSYPGSPTIGWGHKESDTTERLNWLIDWLVASPFPLSILPQRPLSPTKVTLPL